MKQKYIYLIIGFILTSLLVGWFLYQLGNKKSSRSKKIISADGEHLEMNMKEFMEDYVEEAVTKFKNGEKESLKKMLEVMPSLALAEDKEEWKKISSESLDSEKYLASCKTCHVKYKKSYKASYRKRIILIPKIILDSK